MKIVVYDTETTGLPDYKQPSELPHQPHIVEIAALLYDTETRQLIDQLHTLVKHDGWESCPEALAAHGITAEKANAEGIDERDALAAFHDLQLRADLRVGFNEQFDARVMRIAYKRFGDGRMDGVAGDLSQGLRDEIADAFKARPVFCVMKAATKPCNLPPTPAMLKRNMKWNKNPTLAEAYLHYFGVAMENAHSALYDALNTAKLYFAIQGTPL